LLLLGEEAPAAGLAGLPVDPAALASSGESTVALDTASAKAVCWDDEATSLSPEEVAVLLDALRLLWP
jgi:hypothetical protein